GILGILKAGGAYLPMDPTHPDHRLGFLVEEARVPVILTQRNLLHRLPEGPSPRICLDSDWPVIGAEQESLATSIRDSQDLAYVMYTSGSTGRPKGVMVSHRGLSDYLNWCAEDYSVSDGR